MKLRGDIAFPPEIWYYITRDYLHNPRDVLNLARTCRTIWTNLELQIYIKDVLSYKEQFERGHLRHVSWLNANIFIEHAYSSGRRPSWPGKFPDETNWLYGEEMQAEQRSNERHIRQHRGQLDDLEFERYYGGIERSLKMYPDTTAPCKPAPSILHVAAANGLLTTAQKATRAAKIVGWAHYNVLCHPQSLHHPIHLAAMNGHLDIVKLLVEHCSVPPSMPSGNLCMPGKPLKELIEYFAPEIQLTDSNEFTMASVRHPFVLDALGLSILVGYYHISQWLLQYYKPERYIRPSIPDSVEDFSNTSRSIGTTAAAVVDHHQHFTAMPPLHLAALVGADSLVKQMLSKDTPVDFRCEQIQWSTPLMWACAYPGNDKIIKILLQHGANPLLRDVQGRTAAIWALEHDFPSAAHRLMPISLAHGSCRDGDRACLHCHKCALYLSARDDIFLNCTRFILLAKPRSLSHSVLHEVFLEALQGFQGEIEPGSTEQTLKLFIETHSFLRPTERDPRKPRYTPLHFAAGLPYASPEVLRLIIDAGVDEVNASSVYFRQTPLLRAAVNCDYAKMAVLLEKGASADIALNYEGRVILCEESDNDEYEKDKTDVPGEEGDW
ncbi:ankyrin repeat-containing domain protein [Xylariaceae sp. FL0255]|nr:ankyrin repeat-containing domain protein [Xylariaceae sp. FL0255]